MIMATRPAALARDSSIDDEATLKHLLDALDEARHPDVAWYWPIEPDRAAGGIPRWGTTRPLSPRSIATGNPEAVFNGSREPSRRRSRLGF